jgi:hypothetical protein
MIRGVLRKIAWSRVVRIVPDGLTYLGLRPRHKPPSFVGSLSRSVRLREIAVAQGLDFPIWRLDDKLAGRRFAEELGLRVPELYAVGSLEECVAEASRQGSAVIKPLKRYSSHGVVALTPHGEDFFDHIRHRQIRASQLEAYVHSCQVAHEDTLMAEELIFHPGSPGKLSTEWKMYCFGGQVGLMVQGDREPHKRGRRTFVFRLRDFSAVKVPWERGFHRVLTMPDPHFPDGLIEFAETYSTAIGVDFARVDLYEDDRGPAFGEITPHPSAGHIHINYLGRELDRHFGEMWERAEVRLGEKTLIRPTDASSSDRGET